MRVLHCIAQLPDSTGSGIYFRSLLKELNFCDNGLIFACQDDKKYSFQEAKFQYPVEFNTNNLPFSVAGMSDVMPYQSSIYSQMSDENLSLWKNAFKNALLYAKEKFNPDIVICHHLFILSSIARDVFCNIPIYIISHGTDIRQFLQHSDFCKKHIHNISNFDGYLTLSSADKAILNKQFNIDNKKIYVTGGAYNSDIFYPDNHKKTDRIRLFYCGKIAESKGVFELASAFNLIKDDFNIELMLCGNATKSQKGKLHKLSGHSKRFHILHAENQIAMAKLMRSYDIFILPSYYEGLGLVALEALASGLLLVSAKHKGLYELLGDKINTCGIIEYLDLPDIYDTDKPVESQKLEYIARIANAIAIQISRLDTDFSYVNSHIARLSWKGLAQKIRTIMNI